MRNTFLIFTIFQILSGCAQHTFQLPDELKEISALVLYEDSIFFALNDGGNKNDIYVFTKDLKLIKSVEIENVKNHDWEAMAIDKNYLYIGDIGNNSNLRKNLQIHRVSLSRILEKSKVTPETMYISYNEQRNFPPQSNELYFDAESMIFYKDKLWIFTKNRTKPFDGKSYVYGFEFVPGVSKVLKKSFELNTGKGSWMSDSFTDAAVYQDFVYLLTYTGILKYKWSGNDLKKTDVKKFPGYAQMESITVNKKGEIYIANESHKLLGKQKIQKFNWKK